MENKRFSVVIKEYDTGEILEVERMISTNMYGTRMHISYKGNTYYVNWDDENGCYKHWILINGRRNK